MEGKETAAGSRRKDDFIEKGEPSVSELADMDVADVQTQKITILVRKKDKAKALRELADIIESNTETLKVIGTETFWAEVSENLPKGKVNWTEENHDILRKMYKEGMRHSEMAKHFNCSVSAIEAQLNRLGLNNSFEALVSSPGYTQMRHGHPYSQEELDFIKDSFGKGITVEEIADRTHRSVRAIKIQLVHLGLLSDEGAATDQMK